MSTPTESGRPEVILVTSLGDVTVELFAKEAPKTVNNFLEYVDDGFYDGTIFHRVIPGFMVQGGGLTQELEDKSTNPPIVNESENGLANTKGTLAMARTQEKDSATSQFFINLADNDFLDFSSNPPGYAVFGQVTEGMEVVQSMAEVKTGSKKFHDDVPLESIVIRAARRK